jgi:hypothetical protein
MAGLMWMWLPHAHGIDLYGDNVTHGGQAVPLIEKVADYVGPVAGGAR